MQDEARKRAEARRKTWQGGLVSAAEAGDADLSFWRKATDTQRLDAIWQLAVDSLVLSGHHGPRRGLQRSLAGIRRR
jgi:hypothetical protein